MQDSLDPSFKWATQKATEKHFQSFGFDPSKIRRFDDLFVSAIGCGTYLGPADEETDRLYEETLLQAGLQGVNFFDTAIHYRAMKSEKVLQRVVHALSLQGIARDQIVISTKGGYLA